MPLHTHPTLDAPAARPAAPPRPGPQLPRLPPRSSNEAQLLGPSLQDLIVALCHGPVMAYDNGVAVRIGIGDDWYRRPEAQRTEIVNELDQLNARMKALRSRARQLAPDRPDSVRAADEIRQDIDRLIAEARQRIARLPVTFDVIEPNPHPQRTSGVSAFDSDLASPEQMRAW